MKCVYSGHLYGECRYRAFTLTAAGYRRRVAGGLARRLVERLFGAV